MNDFSPLVSVVVSCYNGEEFITESIDSILNQTFTDFELIIINDGSTDGSASIIESYNDPRIVFVDFKDNQGLINCLNFGFEKSIGKYVARFDADDICYPERLERQVEFLEKNPDVSIVGTYANVVDENGILTGVKMKPELSDIDIRVASCFYCRFVHPTVMIRRRVLVNNGIRYDKNALHSEDYVLWSEIALHGKFANIPVAGIKYRVHSSNVSKVYSQEQISNSSKARAKFLLLLGYFCDDSDSERITRLFSFESDVKLEDLKFLASIHQHLKKTNASISDYYFWRLCCFNANHGFSIFKLYLSNQVLSFKSLFRTATLFTLILFKKSR
ncbi:glycosyltransferase family 2 protein [Vibrio mediterranei]